MKIVLYGDSILAYLDKKKITSLEQAVSNDAIVYNFSTGGFNTGDALDRAEFISKLSADIFVLSFGLNDSAPWKQVSLDEFKANLEKMIEIFGAERVVFMAPPLVNEDKQEGDEKRTNNLLLEYVNATKQIAESNNCRFVDINPALKEATEEIHIEDGIHLTELGNEIMLKTLGGILKA